MNWFRNKASETVSFALPSFLLAIIMLSPVYLAAQQNQAVMEVKVEVKRGIGGIQQKIIIGPDNALGSPHNGTESFLGKTKELIEKDSLLLYKFSNYPNKRMLISVNPVQKLVNQKNDTLIFILDTVGSSRKRKVPDIKYFEDFNCIEIKANDEGAAYLWANGRFYLPQKTKGTFRPTGDPTIRCTSL